MDAIAVFPPAHVSFLPQLLQLMIVVTKRNSDLNAS